VGSTERSQMALSNQRQHNNSGMAARMRYLRNSEAFFGLAALPVFLFFWCGSEAEIAWFLRLSPLLLIAYFLGQGAFYWSLKYEQYAKGSALPDWFPRVFRFFRFSNVALLVVVALLIITSGANGAPAGDLGWAAGLWAFAALEHINYFHAQLMYDTRSALRSVVRKRRLRTPVLMEDMRRYG